MPESRDDLNLVIQTFKDTADALKIEGIPGPYTCWTTRGVLGRLRSELPDFAQNDGTFMYEGIMVRAYGRS